MLYTVSQEAASIACRLGSEQDWQYHSAVALRIYTEYCARNLANYLRREPAADLAWRLGYEAASCTRALAPLQPLLHRAATLATMLDAPPPPPPPPPAERPRRPAPAHRVYSETAWVPGARSTAERLRTFFGYA